MSFAPNISGMPALFPYRNVWHMRAPSSVFMRICRWPLCSSSSSSSIMLECCTWTARYARHSILIPGATKVYVTLCTVCACMSCTCANNKCALMMCTVLLCPGHNNFHTHTHFVHARVIYARIPMCERVCVGVGVCEGACTQCNIWNVKYKSQRDVKN